MVRAWADFASTGNPGWPSVNNTTTHAKIWNTDGNAGDDKSAAIRALWAKANFPVLRP